ncbi:MAG: tyrosine--tRNA ligase [Victivallaceae bacterium]
MMNIFRELNERGFCYQSTDATAIEQLLNTEKVKFYVGFDPTGSSLHVGHLLPVMAMRLLQKAGHIPIVLVGGATGQIGDPSGKKSARPILTKEEVAANVEALKAQLARFISVADGKAIFVNNLDWFKDISYIDFLREIGYFFSVNRMLAQDSVKSRLEDGLSFLEFNYSILQAYDFYVLNRDLGCKMEFGGQDQWGNMVAGTELVRRKSGNEVHCMTIPLLLDSNGQKFGKTAGGNNVWLDVNRTGTFDYYQFWRNCDDGAVRQLLLYFSSLPTSEVNALTAAGANINRAKEILAYEATCLAHGEAAAREAFLTAGGKFGFADPDKKVATTSSVAAIEQTAAAIELPECAFERALFEGEGMPLPRLLVESGICKSTSDARRLIQGGGVAIDEVRVDDVAKQVTAADFTGEALVLRAGKKNFRRIVFKSQFQNSLRR